MPKTHSGRAVSCLRVGALGVGEDHTKPAGRNLALWLIENGHVQNFFVEFPAVTYGAALAMAMQAAAAQPPPTRQALGQQMHWENLHVPAIRLGDVMAEALLRGIPVHLADHVRQMTHPHRFATRHANIRNVFRQVTGQAGVPTAVAPGAIGSLLLWGGAHFEGGESLDNYILNLPFVIMD